MDTNEVSRRCGHRLCLVGNVDLHFRLTRGTPAEVEPRIRDPIEHVGRGAGYIICSSNSITSYCKLENVRAMRDAVARNDWYHGEPHSAGRGR